jgi:hypothetical protein
MCFCSCNSLPFSAVIDLPPQMLLRVLMDAVQPKVTTAWWMIILDVVGHSITYDQRVVTVQVRD